jgi:hypothetical protein
VFFVSIYAALQHILSLLFSTSDFYTVSPSAYSWFISTFDLVLVLIVFYWVLSPQRYKLGFKAYGANLISLVDRWWLVLFLILLWAVYEAYVTWGYIQQGYARHDLMKIYDRGGVSYMVISGIFKLLTPFVLFFPASKKIRIIIISGLLVTLVITASRSELRYVFNTYIVMFIFMSFKDLKSRVSGVFALFSSILFLAVIVTIFLQGREISDGFYAAYDTVLKVFQYRSYGYILADIAMDLGEIKDILYPFLGYPADYLVSLAGGDRIASTEFVSSLTYVGISPINGNMMLANVVYPWWAWFIAVFSGWGLLVKLIYTVALSISLLRLNAYSSAIYLLSYVILGSALSHPFMTLTHTMTFFVCLLVDFLVRFNRLNIK